MTFRITPVLGTVRFSSARAAVTQARSPDSSRSFSDTGLDGGAKLAVASIGELRPTSPKSSSALAEYRDCEWPVDVALGARVFRAFPPVVGVALIC